jgi:putative tricarboxylic transport membrane protein
MEFIDGLLGSLTLTNLMFGLIGSLLGTLVGVLPGIGPALAITLLLPITFTVEPTSAMIMFAAIYYGAMYGGSTTSILLNAPGESGSVMTTIEGNKMARAGRAGAALATAAIGSFFAGAVATGLLAVGAPFIADLGLKTYSRRLLRPDGSSTWNNQRRDGLSRLFEDLFLFQLV